VQVIVALVYTFPNDDQNKAFAALINYFKKLINLKRSRRSRPGITREY
jgi:hypothetical protein